MLMLTFMFMVLEVVVSRVTSSLAMLSDSFHMLSDVLALVVALVAERFARRTHATQKNTFGWIRAEVMGALVNAIFLTGLCFAILLEAIERFIEPHEMQQPLVVLGVGVAGLLVNVMGLCLFHHHSGFGNDSGHGHSHGGHGHPKGARGKSNRTGSSDNSVTPGEQRPEQEETNTLVSNSSSSNGLKLDRPGERREWPPQVVGSGETGTLGWPGAGWPARPLVPEPAGAAPPPPLALRVPHPRGTRGNRTPLSRVLEAGVGVGARLGCRWGLWFGEWEKGQEVTVSPPQSTAALGCPYKRLPAFGFHRIKSAS